MVNSYVPKALLSGLLICLAFASFARAEESGGVAPDPVERAKDLMVGNPKQILQIREQIQNSSAARQAPIVNDFADVVPQEVLDLEEMFQITQEPDQIAPKVFIARYQSTAISFVDAYGNPWPIRTVSSFLGDLVTIQKAAGESAEGKDGAAGVDPKDPQAGSFTITAMKHGVVGNITVFLKGLAMPISINLVGKSGMYHRKATMRIDGLGPQTDVAQTHRNDGVVVGTPADEDLNNALFGVSPLGSETMVVQGAEGNAWIKGDYLYLRTAISVFSPKIFRSTHDIGKFSAYKLPKTTTVMGTNDEGKTVTIKIMRHPATAITQETSLNGVSK